MITGVKKRDSSPSSASFVVKTTVKLRPAAPEYHPLAKPKFVQITEAHK
jgi:hypothetical protein